MTTEEESSRIIGSIIGWGLAGITLLIGLTGLLYAGWNFKQDRASLSWPETTGKIIHSDVEVVTHRSNDTDGFDSTKYDVRVHYAYDVNGQAHESRRLRFGSSGFKGRSDANKFHRRFPSGKEVSVYYDPAKPTRCVAQGHAKSLAAIYCIRDLPDCQLAHLHFHVLGHFSRAFLSKGILERPDQYD